MAKTGRPYKDIDRALFEKLCGIHCTEAEICDVLDTTDKTLSGWCKRTYRLSFSDAYKKFAAHGNASLRRAQYQAAVAGNPTLLIWLGKQYLDQRDDAGARAEEAAQSAVDAIIQAVKKIE